MITDVLLLSSAVAVLAEGEESSLSHHRRALVDFGTACTRTGTQHVEARKFLPVVPGRRANCILIQHDSTVRYSRQNQELGPLDGLAEMENAWEMGHMVVHAFFVSIPFSHTLFHSFLMRDIGRPTMSNARTTWNLGAKCRSRNGTSACSNTTLAHRKTDIPLTEELVDEEVQQHFLRIIDNENCVC